MKKVLILCLILSFFLVLVGCDEKKNNSTSNENKVEENEEVNFYTDYDLVSNGTTDYVVLLPNNPTDEEEIAASELSVFFFEATGIKIDTISEADYEEGKYISIGKTQKLKENGIVVNTSTLTSSGYVIKTFNFIICYCPKL